MFGHETEILLLISSTAQKKPVTLCFRGNSPAIKHRHHMVASSCHRKSFTKIIYENHLIETMDYIVDDSEGLLTALSRCPVGARADVTLPKLTRQRQICIKK